MSELARQSQTGRALIWSQLFSEPLFTLYAFLPFILYKNLGASAFEIALLTTLKPLVTILSFYWSAGLRRSGKLKSNVLWAGFWMRAPFLLCPFIDSSWFVIGAAANYMFFYRAGIPAWMEILKRNMGEKKGGRTFSVGWALGYAEGVAISLAMGGLLDRNPEVWKVLFVGAALIGLASLILQARIQVSEKVEELRGERLSLKELIVRPWRDSYRLVKERPDFGRFQWGLTVFGFGLMLIQPALTLFAVDVLGISCLEMAGAISVAKGLGVVLSSPVWARWINKIHILKLSSFVFLLIGLFPILLCLSMWGLTWFYIAYFCYGVGQGGSHLVWNMSGPIFAGKEESSRYSGVNVAMAGLRGAVAPPMGGWLSVLGGPIQVLIAGGVLCFYSGIRLLQSRFVREPTTNSLSIKN